MNVKSTKLYILCGIAVFFFAGCAGSSGGGISVSTAGGGANSPTSPAQVPTSVEYAGGDVTGDISVQTGSSLEFIVKDADGNTITDPSVVTVVLQLPNGTPVTSTSSLGKAATTGSCYGSTSVSGSNIVYSAPVNLPGARSEVCLSFQYNSSEISRKCGLVSVNPAHIGVYSFSDVLSLSGLANPEPEIASDGYGNIFLCYGGTYFKKGVYSETNGVATVSWSDAVRFSTDATAEQCHVGATRDESGRVVVGWTTSSRGGGYKINVIESSDSGDTFGSVQQTSGSIYDVNYDTAGKLHVVFGLVGNLYYMTFSGGSFSSPVQINVGSGAGRLAVVGDGSTVYVVGTDDRNTTQSQNKLDVYLEEIISGAFYSETRISSDADSKYNYAWAVDMDVIVDNNDKPVVSWNDLLLIGDGDTFTSGVMNTYLTSAGIDYLIASTSNFDFAQPLWYSKTSAIIDKANVNYIFWRDQQAVKFVMGTRSGSAISLTDPIELSGGNTALINVATDLSGRNYVVWEEGVTESDRTVTVNMGTMEVCQ